MATSQNTNSDYLANGYKKKPLRLIYYIGAKTDGVVRTGRKYMIKSFIYFMFCKKFFLTIRSLKESNPKQQTIFLNFDFGKAFDVVNRTYIIS